MFAAVRWFMKPLPVFAGVALLGAFGLGGDVTPSEKALSIHRQIQARFNDLSGNAAGKMGVSRLETDGFVLHMAKTRPPGYNEDGMTVGIELFGNHGKPLVAESLSRRYSRLSRVYAGGDTLQFAKEALKKLKSKPTAEISTSIRDSVRIARAFSLTDNKCLKCHAGMKVGDPVMVAVYTVTPMHTPVTKL